MKTTAPFVARTAAAKLFNLFVRPPASNFGAASVNEAC